jgi:sialate O-acetylesterase
MKKYIYIVFFIISLFSAANLSAKIKLPAIFTNNMVLQQQSEVPFWGEATPAKTVKITPSWNNKTVETAADATGKWKANIPTPVYGGPFSIEISDGKKLTLENVMIGEVWLCSGQSNMEMPLAGWGKIMNYQQEIEAANYPNIRLFTVQRNISNQPLTDMTAKSGGWVACSPETVADFSAVAYFFGKNLYEKMKIPIGLINSSWGGTIAEAWTSGHSLKTMPDFQSTVDAIQNKALNTNEIKEKYNQDSIEWQSQVFKADRGFLNGKALWSNQDVVDTDWKSMKVPDNWENQSLLNFDGVVWFRKTIDIPTDWQNKKLSLNLDLIDDNDITYFNGVEVGHTDGWNLARIYTIPASLAKAGKAVISVRVFDTGGGGGIYGNPLLMKLSLSPEKSIPLAGTWQYKIGFNLTEIPAAPVTWNNPNQPTVLYNAMINPIIPYKIKGVIWYQGESNSDKAYQYRELFPLLIRDWRKQWKSDFPFYFVQLANYTPQLPQPSEAAWAELREAQLQTLHLENTGMAVIIDIGDAKDIHPKNKQEVGHRLSLIARANTYNENIAFSGPIYESYRMQGNSICITFKHTENGLKTPNDGPLKGFAIAGLDHVFHWADAVIQGNEVVVSCKEVENPVAVRYAWAANPVCNLYNGASLPASPFRTDDWQGITFGKK